MENPFKQINQPLKQVPQELKSKVMHDIAMAKLMMDLAELFSYNLGYIIDSVSDKRKNNT
jgi:hypothetical protein